MIECPASGHITLEGLRAVSSLNRIVVCELEEENEE
jgi:hypothetical protein